MIWKTGKMNKEQIWIVKQYQRLSDVFQIVFKWLHYFFDVWFFFYLKYCIFKELFL